MSTTVGDVLRRAAMRRASASMCSIEGKRGEGSRGGEDETLEMLAGARDVDKRKDEVPRL